MLRVIGSSVRGPSHIKDNLPCQDAWLGIVKPMGCFITVCDGMGSRQHAREGAKAATRAGVDAWRLWSLSSLGKIGDFIKILESSWHFRLGSLPPEEACTTCLFYAEDGHGRAIQAQLGDGLIVRRLADGTVAVHPSRAFGFGLTHALGSSHTLADWSFTFVEPLADGEVLLLATDGVAEDLVPERLGEFAAWLVNRLGPLKNPSRILRKELTNWPTHHHHDDKTLVITWKP